MGVLFRMFKIRKIPLNLNIVCIVICLVSAALNATYFSVINIHGYLHFDGYSGFDLAIADQGIWLLSKIQKAFVTTRGLHIFGDHTPYIYLFLAPLYWIWEDIRFLLIFHSLFLSAGAIFIYLISRNFLLDYFFALAFSLLYLIYIPLNFLNLELMFSDAFASTLLLAAFYFLQKNKLGLAFFAMALTLFCKEDFAIIVSALSVYAFFFKNKKFGIIMLFISIAWFVFNLLILLPYFNGYGYFRHLYGYAVFGRLGNSANEVITNLFSDPQLFLSVALTKENYTYLFKLLSPLLFLPFFGIEVFLVATATIFVNLIGAYYYTHFIEYHYTATIIPFIFIAAIVGFKRIVGGNNYLKIILLLTLFISTIYSYRQFGPERNISGIKALIGNLDQMFSYSEKEKEVYKMISSIPKDSSISVSYDFLPHFSHRKTCYIFPVPFKAHYWGINGENLPAELPNYLFLDKQLTNEEGLSLIPEDRYTRIFEGLRVIIYKIRD